MIILGTPGLDKINENSDDNVAYIPVLFVNEKKFVVLRGSDTFDKGYAGYTICDDKEGVSPYLGVEFKIVTKDDHIRSNMIYQNLKETLDSAKNFGKVRVSREFEQPLQYNKEEGRWKPVELVKTDEKMMYVGVVEDSEPIPGYEYARLFHVEKVMREFGKLRTQNVYYDSIEPAVYSLQGFDFAEKEQLVGVYNNTSIGRLADFKLNDKSGKIFDRLRSALENYPSEVRFMQNEDNFKDLLYIRYKDRCMKREEKVQMTYEDFIDKIYDNPSKKNRDIIKSITTATENYNYEKYIGIHFHEELTYTTNGAVYTYAVSDALHDYDCNYHNKDKKLVGSIIDKSIRDFKYLSGNHAINRLTSNFMKYPNLTETGQRFLRHIAGEYITMKRLKFLQLERDLSNTNKKDKENDEQERKRLAKEAEKQYWKRFHEVNPDVSTPYHPVVKPKIKPNKKENPDKKRYIEITM